VQAEKLEKRGERKMFSTILKEVTGLLDRRFVLYVLFPSLLFWGLLLGIWEVGSGSLAEAIRRWDAQEGIFKTLQLIGFIAWVTFFSFVLDSQLTTILRLYEGYWDFPLGRYLHALGKGWHVTHLEKLQEALPENPRLYEDIYLCYPLPPHADQVMPTRLGNILKSAELYPMDRYQIDAVLIWPRLYHLCPGSFIQTVIEARGATDFMLVVSLLGGLFACVAGAYWLMVGAAWWRFLACFWGGMCVAWLAYRGAHGNALGYAEQIKVAFDLYRHKVLKQLSLPVPNTLEEERRLWSDLCQFLYRNIPMQAHDVSPPVVVHSEEEPS
jgi:hypothetical protein